MTFWLTEDDRQRYMEALAETTPDSEIVPYLDRLNAIPGVCTVSSCFGFHPHSDGMHPTVDHGFISLHLEEEKGILLEENVESPRGIPRASTVTKEWTRLAHSPRRVIVYTIWFHGLHAWTCLEALIQILSGNRWIV